MSTRRSRARLSAMRPAPSTSASASAICAETSARCNRRHPPLPVDRASPRKVLAGSATLARPAASTPSPIPMTTATAIRPTMSADVASTASSRGIWSAVNPSFVEIASATIGIAAAAPSSPIMLPSTMKRRTSAPRLAPIARESAISPRNRSARSRHSVATFAVAMSSRMPTRIPRSVSSERTGATIDARNVRTMG